MYIYIYIYIYTIYTPNLGFDIAVSAREKEQGSFREGEGEQGRAPREHYGRWTRALP